MAGQRGTGVQGARGLRGARGATGAAGPRGKIGKTGKQGAKDAMRPLRINDVLDLLVTHFDDVYRQLNLQMKMIVKMQEQLDVMSVAPGRGAGR